MVEVLSAEMVGSDSQQITDEPWSSMQKGQRKQTNKTTLRSERRGVQKSLQKEKKKGLDRVSIVRDGRFRDFTRTLRNNTEGSAATTATLHTRHGLLFLTQGRQRIDASGPPRWKVACEKRHGRENHGH